MTERLRAGTEVEVRTRFDRSWAAGFEIVESAPGGGYHVRRTSDAMVVPAVFADDEVRRARRPDDMWWF